MLGLLRWHEDGSARLERTQLLGLPLLQATVAPGGRWERQRLGRAARKMARQGVHRVLVPKGFGRWEELARHGLSEVEQLPLYRAMADQLVMAELKYRGVEAHRACVALRGEWVDSDLARTARLLCPRVRTLIVQVNHGGEKLTRELYRMFGAGAPPRGQADVAVRFGGAGEDGELVLCGQPELLELEPNVPGLELPEELEPVPFLTALWQSGLLDLGQIRVIANKCS